jgi:hypothetical protein
LDEPPCLRSSSMQTDKPMSPKAEQLKTWFETARLPPYDLFARLDEARARGEITRDEYVALLDAKL